MKPTNSHKLKRSKGRAAVEQTDFEAWLKRDGYELRQGEIKPNEHRPAHVHDFDARLFILDGALTLVRGDNRTTFRPGDVCEVAANTLHEEHTESDGVRYMAGRRVTASGAAA
jgi:mannose-6-phosphate isomerase-like protein (cupin superfamily)